MKYLEYNIKFVYEFVKINPMAHTTNIGDNQHNNPGWPYGVPPNLMTCYDGYYDWDNMNNEQLNAESDSPRNSEKDNDDRYMRELENDSIPGNDETLRYMDEALSREQVDREWNEMTFGW